MSGATTRSPWTSAYQSVRNATGSPSQNRRRERRMYQFETSSTNDSYARTTSTVSQLSYPSRASTTSERVRSTSQRSSGSSSPFRPVREILPFGRPVLDDVGVVDEELAGVPEREQPPLDLVRRPEAEEEVLVRRLGAVLPAHDVRAHARERILGVDRVPPRAVHLAARSRRASSRSRGPAGTARAGQRDRHEVLRVEPESDLLAHLGDPVGREPLLPVRVVGEVGGREPLRGAGRVSLGDVFVVLPAERRERDDARVEPDVADLRDPRGPSSPHASQRIGTSSIQGRRSSSSWSRPRDRALGELGLRADDGDMAALALVDRAAAARSSGAARCSSRPCCGASRPCACPCTRASTRRWRSRRATVAEARRPRSASRR